MINQREAKGWLRVIARLGLPTGILTILMFPLFILVIAMQTDMSHYAHELLAAADNLLIYRLYTFLEVIVFTMIMVVTVAMGYYIRTHYPVAGSIVILLGIGLIAGILTNFERLGAIGRLAEAYGGDQIARKDLELLSYVSHSIHQSHFIMTWFMQSLVAGAIAYSVRSIDAVPGYLGNWFILPAITGMVLTIGSAFSAPMEILLIVLPIHVIFGVGALWIAASRWASGLVKAA